MSDSPFLFETRGGAAPDSNKPKVFFSCHPDDFERYFRRVCDDIFATQDCVIFYTKDMNARLEDENTLFDLGRMDLFVFPVTLKLLNTDNRSIDFDLKFAREHRIPILPLLMERGIYEIYKKPDKFGELQYLKPFDDDKTSIDYKEKLKKHLEAVLISDELMQNIKGAFDAYIFLSYRKKDRRYANELMRMIHRNSECEDIAIWFDEFLVPGESFRTGIGKIIEDSRLFALLVTPQLLERLENGAPNFIMAEEYPTARNLGKPIFAAEMEDTDPERLKAEFEGIPECSDIHDAETFRKMLLSALEGITIPENNDDPQHNYLIGLAYLKGIDVEIDTERGLRLITKAAEAGFPHAMVKLYNMYRTGDSVQLDYSKALYWSEKLYAFAVANWDETDMDRLNSLYYLADACFMCAQYERSLDLFKECYEVRSKALGPDNADTITMLFWQATCYDCSGQVMKALDMYRDCYERYSEAFGDDDIRTLEVYGYWSDQTCRLTGCPEQSGAGVQECRRLQTESRPIPGRLQAQQGSLGRG